MSALVDLDGQGPVDQIEREAREQPRRKTDRGQRLGRAVLAPEKPEHGIVECWTPSEMRFDARRVQRRKAPPAHAALHWPRQRGAPRSRRRAAAEEDRAQRAPLFLCGTALDLGHQLAPTARGRPRRSHGR